MVQITKTKASNKKKMREVMIPLETEQDRRQRKYIKKMAKRTARMNGEKSKWRYLWVIPIGLAIGLLSAHVYTAWETSERQKKLEAYFPPIAAQQDR